MIQKRSVVIMGHATSLSIETEFWNALATLAHRRNTSVARLIQDIDQKRTGNLSSAVRVFVLQALQEIVIQNGYTQ